MNRLILVGNGFDLAHGLKTGYKDFIIWYIVQCFGNVSYVPKTYQDELLQINFYDVNAFIQIINSRKPGMFNVTLSKEDLTNFVVNCFEEQTIKELLNINENDTFGLISVGSNNRHVPNRYNGGSFSVNILSGFLRGLILNCQECNWVDIENEYFEQLKKCKNKEGIFDFNKVKQLNKELAYLKNRLREYLKEQTVQGVAINHQLIKMMYSDFEFKDFKSIEGYESESKYRRDLGYNLSNKTPQHKLYFLNFNYTQTLNLYNDNVQSNFRCYGVNHIHGELDSETNPVIFGFGDEHDKEYLTFEEQGRNELFEHIKSYQYFKTNNYRNLVSFLNSDKYQVYIMGHSCGLSDRTMFKEIFDHENCKSVKIFHYTKNKDENDFWEKTVNLGRHFSDKGRMRKLIVDYRESDTFPQSGEASC